ncbi:hypothetical protein RvY_12597 [Ramazzottius varieornatus]|uniref:N-lysine methyltransferase n=1 Tax=Ramazzottius varieornatus TaxID=947166 RepID=A0A1D1VK15_RAMVA|nr:hypothetical protein RvY_12597 [Ramazzottius varieornatus]
MDGETNSADMEPSAKRLKTTNGMHEGDGNGVATNDVLQRVEEGDDKLREFVRWCVENENPITFNDKVFLGKKGSAANYGMTATKVIEVGEVIFRIPQKRLLSWQNLPNAVTLRADVEKMAVSNRWTPTILAVMLESSNPASPWAPYLDLFLRRNSLDVPLLWETPALATLTAGLNVADRVKRDKAQITSDFAAWIFPALKKYKGVDQSLYETLLEEAHRVSAFVMSYSFTRPKEGGHGESDTEEEESDEEEGQGEATRVGNALAEVPLMIPVADFLNASVSKNNAKLHWAEAEGQEEEGDLTMISTKAIKAGEEIFNTYGEISNEEMLYLYGYAEDDTENPHEEVFIPTEHLKQVATSIIQAQNFSITADEIQTRWEYLQHRKVVGDEYPIVLGRDGILTDDDLDVILRVMSMSDQEFVEYTQNDNEDADQTPQGTYALENLVQLPDKSKAVLRGLLERRMADYPRHLVAERMHLERLRGNLRAREQNEDEKKELQREYWVSCVRQAQLVLLTTYAERVALPVQHHNYRSDQNPL